MAVSTSTLALLWILVAAIRIAPTRTFSFPHYDCQRHLGRLRKPITKAPSLSVSVADDVATLSDESPGGNYLAELNATLTFPPYSELMQLAPGECVVTDSFSLGLPNGMAHDFCVKLYPRGGGHASSSSNAILDRLKRPQSGFGMSYQVVPWFGGKEDEKMGVYLQYLPRPNDSSQVDASFALRLKGHQTQGPRFDVEWRAGMRFVSSDEAKLQQGRANDFGAHLMQTRLLESFVGADENPDRPIYLDVEVKLHDPSMLLKPIVTSEGTTAAASSNDRKHKSLIQQLFSLLNFQDIRKPTDAKQQHQHDPEQVRVGRVVVPVLSRLSQRPQMFQQGTYPGVEYRLMRVMDRVSGQDLFYSRPGADYELRPIYPLVRQLERPWPVRVNEQDIPNLYTPKMYNSVSALGSVVTAVAGLLTAFAISQAVSLFYIPSRSMEPTLQVGDVLLVEKVTPRLDALIRNNPNQNQMGNVVLFHPPRALQDIVARSGGGISDRDLFVKRIAAKPGDVLSVQKSGDVTINGQRPQERRDLCTAEPLRLIEQYIEPKKEGTLIEPGQVAVLGDCSSVSIDSRVWGPLPTSEIVGRPLFRLWPPSHMGAIPDLPTVSADWSE